MKTLQIKSILWSLLFLSITIVGTSSCKKDEATPGTLKEQLVGTWNVTSFKVNSIELVGLFFESSEMKFDAYSGASGNAVFTTVDTDHMSDVQNLTYVVDETNKKLTTTDDVGDTNTFDLSITGDNFTITGDYNGQPAVIKASRK